MNNFGVVEIATAKTTSAPGWAYVPERQRPLNIPATGTTTNRKRPRNAAAGAGRAGAAALSLADANARQEAKARREIEILDRDNSRDVQIAVPTRPRGHAKRASNITSKKSTSNVRRILQSQKTFTNHLDDYLALESSTTTTTTTNTITSNNTQAGGTPAPAETRTTSTTITTTGGGGGQRQRQSSTSAAPSSSRRSQQPPPTSIKQEQQLDTDADTDIQMQDAPPSSSFSTSLPQKPQSEILTLYTSAPPLHPEDNNPLLASRLPPIPSDEELRALLAAAPLTYLEARGTWRKESRYPTREFCAICGYWGRVRCMKCGTRVCALDCLETHREECVTRYGL